MRWFCSHLLMDEPAWRRTASARGRGSSSWLSPRFSMGRGRMACLLSASGLRCCSPTTLTGRLRGLAGGSRAFAIKPVGPCCPSSRLLRPWLGLRPLAWRRPAARGLSGWPRCTLMWVCLSRPLRDSGGGIPIWDASLCRCGMKYDPHAAAWTRHPIAEQRGH